MSEKNSYQELTYLPVSSDPFNSALAYLAVVAYPNDILLRDKFIIAAKTWYLRAAKSHRGIDFKALPPEFDGYKLFRKEQIPTNLNRWQATWSKYRAHAANELNYLLNKGSDLSKVSFSTRQRYQVFIDKHGEIKFPQLYSEVANGYARVWKSTLPVLHYSYALFLKGGYNPDVRKLIAQPLWIASSLSVGNHVLDTLIENNVVNNEQAILLVEGNHSD